MNTMDTTIACSNTVLEAKSIPLEPKVFSSEKRTRSLNTNAAIRDSLKLNKFQKSSATAHPGNAIS